MDVSVWWSVTLAVLGIAGIYLTTHKLYWGYVVGVFVQLLWAWYAIHTHQWGFILSAFGYAWVNGLGWWRWTRRNDSPPASDVPITMVSQETVTVRVPKEES